MKRHRWIPRPNVRRPGGRAARRLDRERQRPSFTEQQFRDVINALWAQSKNLTDVTTVDRRPL